MTRALSPVAGTAGALAVGQLRHGRPRRGVAVTPSSAFATRPGHAPNGARLAFSSPPGGALEEGLRILADLLAQGPDNLSE